MISVSRPKGGRRTELAEKDAGSTGMEALASTVEARREVFRKHKAAAGNDPKRRLALKRLKRAQRALSEARARVKKASEKKEK